MLTPIAAGASGGGNIVDHEQQSDAASDGYQSLPASPQSQSWTSQSPIGSQMKFHSSTPELGEYMI